MRRFFSLAKKNMVTDLIRESGATVITFGVITTGGFVYNSFFEPKPNNQPTAPEPSDAAVHIASPTNSSSKS